MTVRQVFYALVAAGVISRSESAYRKVGYHLVWMRRRGILPYHFIADNTRWMRKPQTYDSVYAFLETGQKTYRRGLWQGQSVYVEIWCEKDALAARGIDPYIATGRQPYHQSWQAYFAQQPQPPAADASAMAKMAYKLRTEMGQAIYRLRKSTVEPVIGIIKEVLGFRQFSLRGLPAVTGEWTLVCLAYNLKRLHTLRFGS